MKPWLLLAFVGLLSYPAPVGAAPEHRANGDIWHGVWATQWTETVRDDSRRLVLKESTGNLVLSSRDNSNLVTGHWECECRARVVGFAYGYGGIILAGPEDDDKTTEATAKGGESRCNEERGKFFLRTDDADSFHGWFTMGDTESPLARRSPGDEVEVCHPAVEVRDEGRVDPRRGEWAARSSSVLAALDCLLQEMVSDAGL
jgi:hypothetical protein